MALDNLHCPQFVDFTNNATFDMYDGADHFFEKGVVGELGLGFEDNVNNKDGIDELIAALNNNTNLNQKSTNDKKDSGISEALSISPSSATNQTATITTTATKHSKLPQTKKSNTQKQRTNSSTSNVSIASIQQQAKNKHESTKPQNPQSIVKKTIAKITASFKTTKQPSETSTTQFKPKTKHTTRANDKKKQDGPLKVEHQSLAQTNKIEVTTSEVNSSTNRRCSSVPRTLKERQELTNKQITLGEKIQSFFSRDAYKTLSKKSQKPPILESATQSKNEKQPICGVLGDKSPNTLNKPRQRSVDRKEQPQPTLMHQGVKFIPVNRNTPLETSTIARTNTYKANTSTNTSLVDSKKPINGRLNNSVNGNKVVASLVTNKENVSLDVSSSTQDTSTCLQNSLLLGDTQSKAAASHNTSTMSTGSRKIPQPSTQVKVAPSLHTEARAHKRHQYDQYLKDKERMAELIKKNLQMQKEIEDKNEIRKLRAQLNFKSKPFKELKPMEVKPSDRPLTEPKSPEFIAKSTSLTKSLSTNNLSKM